MNNFVAGLTVSALIGSGLIAGTFFAFSTFIMPAFTARPADEAASAMKEINVVVLRSPFIAVFVGTALASLVLAAYGFAYGTSAGSYLLIAGSAAYILLCFAVTVIFNVPLNNKLAATRPDDLMAKAVWEEYLERWTRWNHLRTAGSLIAAILFAGSLLY
jgi:uncharacterized membrane protein